MWLAILAFLSALFLPGASGEPSVFDNILVTLMDLLIGAAQVAPKAASFVNQIPV